MSARAGELRAWWCDFRCVLRAGGGGASVGGVSAMMLLCAALDLLGIGLVAPFVGLVMGQGATGLPAVLQGLVARVPLEALGLGIVVVFVAKSFAAYRMQRRIVRFAEAQRAILMQRLLEAFLARDYAAHLARPSAERVNVLFWHTAHYAGATLGTVLRLVTDIVVLLAVVALLLAIDVVATIILALMLAVVVAGTARLVRRELADASRAASTGQARALAVVQDSLGAFREIRVLGAAAAFQQALARAADGLADATARQNAVHQLPRAAVETALVAFLVLVSLWAVRGGADAAGLVPVLGAMGVAAMRLMPIATSLLSGLNNLRASRHALGEIAAALREAGDRPADPLPAPARAFERLALRGIGFSYPGADVPALRGIDLDLRRGEVLGIAGRSGAGKSTLVDLLLGLLRQHEGTIESDGTPVSLAQADWQGRCAYIPQDVFLVAGSLRDNIVFGAAEDPARLADAVRLAGLADVVARHPAGLDAPLGERGVGLSGGQRQRVAIARALYRAREVLVMDEATSALDAATEGEVVAAIHALRGRCTIVVVAHRPALLAACDRVLQLEHGRVVVAEPARA